MANKKPKPISINPHADHKPEDAEPNMELADFSGEPIEQTLEEARAEEAATGFDAENPPENPLSISHSDAVAAVNNAPTRVRLNTKPIRAAIATAALDYLSTAGVMPSILDLFEIVREDPALAHLTNLTDDDGNPLFNHRKLASQVNRIRKDQQAAIAAKKSQGEPTDDMVVLPPLARTQRTVTPRVSDAEALARLVAERLARLPKAEPVHESATV